MKSTYIFLVFVLAFCNITSGTSLNEINDPNIIVQEMQILCNKIKEEYYHRHLILEDKMEKIKLKLKNETDIEKKLNLLIAKDVLSDESDKIKNDLENDITKIRYLKGMEIIKILYDKVLSLDHHFSAVRTFSEINKISNPNSYPEFTQLKDILKEKKEKKSLDLTSLLGSNIIVSVIQTIANLVNSGLTKEVKDAELKNVECILDFTIRMHNDLNLIFFETSYLQASNDEIKKDIENMFKEYAKPIEYLASLSDARSNDDWDNLKDKLGKYLAEMTTSADKIKMHKMQVNLEFSIDRLLQFISKYNNFIDDGVKFYQKFRTILNSYENETQCQTKLPIEYVKLKGDIDVSIDKFNVAYKPVEINGTKMKEILYGVN